jgi:hypothetical protein
MSAAPFWNKIMPENDVGYVYFVRMGVTVKIGHTMDVRSRLKTIQTACPGEIHLAGFVPGSPEVERDFHRQFRQYRTHGEWFTIQGTLATFLRDCTEPVAIPPPITRKNFFDAILTP